MAYCAKIVTIIKLLADQWHVVLKDEIMIFYSMLKLSASVFHMHAFLSAGQ